MKCRLRSPAVRLIRRMSLNWAGAINHVPGDATTDQLDRPPDPNQPALPLSAYLDRVLSLRYSTARGYVYVGGAYVVWRTVEIKIYFYARKQLLLSARLSHRNSVRPSVTRVDQSKAVQARITKSSPSALWKTLVSGTVKLFHKFKGVTPTEGAKWQGRAKFAIFGQEVAVSQ